MNAATSVKSRKRQCKWCKGRGWANTGYYFESQKCDMCRGEGFNWVRPDSSFFIRGRKDSKASEWTEWYMEWFSTPRKSELEMTIYVGGECNFTPDQARVFASEILKMADAIEKEQKET